MKNMEGRDGMNSADEDLKKHKNYGKWDEEKKKEK